MTPYILLGHYDDRCAATKRQNPRVVIIMQKQVDHCGSVPRGDECVISVASGAPSTRLNSSRSRRGGFEGCAAPLTAQITRLTNDKPSNRILGVRNRAFSSGKSTSLPIGSK